MTNKQGTNAKPKETGSKLFREETVSPTTKATSFFFKVSGQRPLVSGIIMIPEEPIAPTPPIYNRERLCLYRTTSQI